MLRFREEWRFESPGRASDGVSGEFLDLIRRIATQGNRWNILEHFEHYFAISIGTTGTTSSSESWAETDLMSYMDKAEENAPLFVEAFYSACEVLRESDDYAIPSVSIINQALARNHEIYEIRPPDLVLRSSHAPVSVSAPPVSFDEQAQSTIRRSLEESERLLHAGKNRQAVQEILWLLETISTAFSGLDVPAGTIEGKYFNKIAANMRSLHRGETLDQALSWVTKLHGYLSSPTGGAIRHGAQLANARELEEHEARLYCNLIRSYVSYLLAEHQRLSQP